MSAYYTYLISSLPLLSFANRAPFNLEDFFIKCKDLIPEKEFKILRDTCTLENDILDTTFSLSLAKWVDFEFTLRNELVRARAARKKVDALKYLRLPE